MEYEVVRSYGGPPHPEFQSSLPRRFPVTLRKWIATVAVAAGSVAFASGADPDAKGAKVPEPSQLTFGTLRAMPAEVAKAKVADWLKAAGKLDTAKLESIWQVSDKTVMTRVLESIALGNPDAQKVLDNARDVTADAPTAVPAAIAAEKDAFVKTNLGAAYARALAGKKVYEEALLAVKDAKPEELVDPSAFYFFKAVAEHSLGGYQKAKKIDAVNTIVRLVDDVVDAPDRYRVVATQMFFDIQNWAKDDKDLGNIAKLMDNSGRRLDLARGGNTTQDIQKRIIFRLDEKIKELENQQKGGS
jgi:hypothetical protein